MNTYKKNKIHHFYLIAIALISISLVGRDGAAGDAHPNTSSASVTHEELYKKLHVFYKGGLQSKFGDAPIKRVPEGVIYDFEKPGVIIEFMRGASNNSELITRVWLETSNTWEDRPIAECKDKDKKVSLELIKNSDCLNTDSTYDCIVANCG